MELGRELSILAEHFDDFARLNGIRLNRILSVKIDNTKSCFPIWPHISNNLRVYEIIDNPRQIYLYRDDVGILSPDGIDFHIYKMDSDIHLVTTIDKLEDSLKSLKIGSDYYNTLSDGTPLRSIRESLIGIRRISMGMFDKDFEEYWHKCMNHLSPTMMKSAR